MIFALDAIMIERLTTARYMQTERGNQKRKIERLEKELRQERDRVFELENSVKGVV